MISRKEMWADHFSNKCVHEIDIFAQCLTEHVLPAFANIDSEAEKVSNSEYERLINARYSDEHDVTDLAERAEEKGADFYMEMSNMAQGIRNLFTSGVWHLFVQQLLFFHRKELLDQEDENKPGLLTLKKVKECFEKQGIQLERLNSWAKLMELRRVANAVKHADGESATELKTLRPGLFTSPMTLGPVIKCDRTPIFTPLAGEGIYVSVEDFNSYIAAIKAFWSELREAVLKQ